MEFRFETKLTMEDYRALAFAMGKTTLRKSRTLTRAVLLIFGVLILLAAAWMLFVWIIAEGVEQGVVITPLVTGVIGLVIGGYYIYYYCTYDRRMAKRSRKMLEGSRILDQTVTLTETACLVASDGASSTYTYPAFLDLLYCRERYCLVLDKSHALVLPLANLVEGDPRLVGTFLEKKLGRPVKVVR